MVKLCRAWFYPVQPRSFPRHLGGLLKLKTAWPEFGPSSVLTGLRIRVIHPRPCQNLNLQPVDQHSLLNLRAFLIPNPWARPNDKTALSNHLRHPLFTTRVLRRHHTFSLPSDHCTLANLSPEAKLSPTKPVLRLSTSPMDKLSRKTMDTATRMPICPRTLVSSIRGPWSSKAQ